MGKSVEKHLRAIFRMENPVGIVGVVVGVVGVDTWLMTIASFRQLPGWIGVPGPYLGLGGCFLGYYP